MKYTQGQSVQKIVEGGDSLWVYTDDTATVVVTPDNVSLDAVTTTVDRTDGVVKYGPYYKPTVVNVTATSLDADVRNYEFIANPTTEGEFGEIMTATGGMTPSEIGNSIKGQTGAGEIVGIPNSLLSTIPVRVFKDDSGRFSTDFDSRDWEPNSFDATYFVDQASGNNANSGLTEALPVETIKQALILIAAAGGTNFELIINSGYFDRLDGWASQQIGSKNIVVRCRGDVTSSGEFSGLSWSDATGGAYSVGRSAVGVVYDKTTLNGDGDWTQLEPVVDSAACIATAGTMYTDGTTLWVHRSDGLVPTFDNTMVGTTTINVRPAENGRTIIYGMKMYGGADAISCNMGANVYSDVILVNCEAGYTNTNAVDFNGARYCITQNVLAKGASNDGFNYQAGASLLNQIAVEINCTARTSGLYATDTNNNASSIHDDGVILRINGKYTGSRGPVVNDIDNAVVWNVGCYSDNAIDVSGNLSANYSNGVGTTTYIDNCVSGGQSEYDAYSAGTMTVINSPSVSRTSGNVETN